MATTLFWIAAGLTLVLFAAWRLRRANHTLHTILREERDRTDLEPALDPPDEPVTHKPGRHRKRH